MKFREFEDSIVVMYEHRPDSLTYAILGVAGEAGEVIEKYKKAMRVLNPEDIPNTVKGMDFRSGLLDELGDTLWYIAKAAKLLGADLETVARMNMKKLAYRRVHGKGSDDACS